MKKYFMIIFVLLILAIVGYIFISPDFERIPPKIIFDNGTYWNTKNSLKIILEDNTGIKYYKIKIDNYQIYKELNDKNKRVVVNFPIPKKLKKFSGKKILKIEAGDISKWQFFAGNIIKKKFTVFIDNKKPILNIISHSYGIGRGGSALIVYKAFDKNLSNTYVLVNDNYIFKSFPYKKNGFYFCIFTWPIKEKILKVQIIALDRAKNKSKVKVHFFIKHYQYKTSKIILNKNFLQSKVREILSNDDMEIPEDFIEAFKLMNENLRAANESLLEETTKEFPIVKIDKFNISPFHPLKNAAKKASFGDHRYYFYNGEKVSESWHLGLDLASIKNAPIIASNSGKVVYAKYTGIYGNTLIIYHGFGLFSSYSHCSSFFKNQGDIVKKGDIIAKTGATGAVFGDHLHFAIFIQGVESQPLEWLDKHWIKDNILKVLDEANSLIGG